MFLLIFFVIALGLRLTSLFISIRNEKRLKANGGIEHGKKVSIYLALLHTIFYLVSFVYAWLNPAPFTTLTVLGLFIFTFAIIMLFVVIKSLGPIWSVKLIIAKDHILNKSLIFKYFKHPNYFLNIIPELIGLTIVLNSYKVFIVLFPFYALLLYLRIRQEEAVMAQTFNNY